MHLIGVTTLCKKTPQKKMYYERLLKFANNLQTPIINKLLIIVPIKITILFRHCHYRNETRDSTIMQIVGANM
jgi:hypothetical protein